MEARVSQGAQHLIVPRSELPDDAWFRIGTIGSDLELTRCDWQQAVIKGYYCATHKIWEQ